MKATINSEGKITIPTRVINDLNLVKGDRVAFVKLDDNRYEFIALNRDVRTLKGLFKSDYTVSVADMNNAPFNEIN